MQLLVRAALDDIAAGADAATVAAKTTQRRSRVTILFLLDTLTYLHRGGRIGRAQAFVGGLLSVKPVLTVHDGEVAPLARVRSRTKGIGMIIDEVCKCAPLARLAAFHADAPDSMADLETQLHAAVPDMSAVGGRIGPVVGAYSGPGAVGVACLGVD
jgi:DegV family protein with EDD domain